MSNSAAIIQQVQGPPGPSYATGSTGPMGPTGQIGPPGPTGQIGPEGPVGTQGMAGQTGPVGQVGPQGPTGPQGQTGPAGLGTEQRAYWGSGYDGAATADGSTAVNGMTLIAADYYLMVRPVAFTNLTINSGVTVNTNGVWVQTTGTLTVNGIIDDSGSNAVNNTPNPGIGAAWTALGGGSDGGQGGAASLDGQSFAQGIIGLGGAGGQGGGSGGAGGAIGNLPPGTYYALDLGQYLMGGLITSVSGASGPIQPGIFAGGTGGGAGQTVGSSSPIPGLGGGGGGGYLLICAKILAGNGTIQSNGGTGGSGPSYSYGGGGGGGGFIVVIVGSDSGFTGTVTTTGGAPGSGTFGSGSAGSDGNIVKIYG